MKCIFANYLDFERLKKFLDQNEIEFEVEGVTTKLHVEYGSVEMKVIWNTIDVEDFYEIEDEDDNGVKIIESEINVREILRNGQDEVQKVWKTTDIRVGMVLVDQTTRKFYVAMQFDQRNGIWTIVEICQGGEVGCNKIEYRAQSDFVLFEEKLLVDGVIDFEKIEKEENFSKYEFAGYIEAKFYYKAVVSWLGKERYYSDEIITEFPYDFMEKEKLFEISYSHIPKIRFYSEKSIEAIKIFLDRISFFGAGTELVLMLALAISTNNNNIMDLIELLNYEYDNLQDEELLEFVLDQYDVFLCNNFHVHYLTKYIPINDFISFVINRY